MSEERRQVHPQEPVEGAKEAPRVPGAEKAGEDRSENPGPGEEERSAEHPQEPAEGDEDEVDAPGAGQVDRSG